MFEKASRQKLRFKSTKGNISSEDLWDLSESGLDAIYKGLSKDKKSELEDSLLGTADTKASRVNDLKMSIVKHVFDIKVIEKKKKEERALKAAKKKQLMELLVSKQDEELKGKGTEEIKNLIAALGEDEED